MEGLSEFQPMIRLLLVILAWASTLIAMIENYRGDKIEAIWWLGWAILNSVIFYGSRPLPTP